MARRDRSLVIVLAVLLAVFLAGFAKNFYLRYWLGSRPLTTLAYVHGALMTAWLAIFIAQVALVARSRSDLHRVLGRYAMWTAVLVVLVGVLTIGASAHRQFPGSPLSTHALVFVAFDGLSLLLFGTLVLSAYCFRANAAIHRRLMLMGLVALLPPAFGRLIAYMDREHVEVAVLMAMTLSVLACGVVDFLAWKRTHPAIVIPGVAVIAVNLMTYFAQLAT